MSSFSSAGISEAEAAETDVAVQTFDEIWQDVTPIEQDDGPAPVAAIAYTEQFNKLSGLFRAVLKSGEISMRSFDLTEDLLELNPANYTVWQYRRECLQKLGDRVRLSDELDFMDQFAEDNPKNYQIWHHRRWVAQQLGDGSRELQFTAMVFQEDAKNYHAWAHRQWAVLTYGLWGEELQTVETLLQQDIRNNSAWNHRWFCVHRGPNPVTAEVLQREMSFAFDSLAAVQLNESAWNYARGLAKHHRAELRSDIKTKCKAIVDAAAAAQHSNPFAMALLADLSEEEGTEASLAAAEQLLVQLVAADQIRAKSWVRRVQALRQRLEALRREPRC